MGWLDGGSTPSGSTTTTNTTALPQYVSDQQRNLINESNLLASRSYPIYPGQRIAGFTPAQQGAASWIQQSVTQGLPNLANQYGFSQGVSNQVAGYNPLMVRAAQIAPLGGVPQQGAAPQQYGGGDMAAGPAQYSGGSQPQPGMGGPLAGGVGYGNDTRVMSSPTTADWQAKYGGATPPAPQPPQAANPLTQLYQSILGRAPDQAGLAYWQNAVANGTSLDSVRQSFLSSPEYQGDVSAGKVDPSTGNFLAPPSNFQAAPASLPGVGQGYQGGQGYPGMTGGSPFYGVQPNGATSQGALPGIAGVPLVSPQSLSGTDLSPYMNPFTSSVINGTNANMARQNDILNTQAGSRAEAAGAYGGSRDALVQAENNRNLQQTMGLTDAQLGAANFAQAQTAATGDIARNQAAQTTNQGVAAQQASLNAQLSQQASLANQQANQNAQLLRLQGAGQGASLANSGLQNQLSGEQALYNLGTQQQAINQQNLSLANQDFLNQFNYPSTQLQQQLSVLGGLGNSGGTTTQNQPYFTNPTANTLSTLLGAGQLAGNLGSAYNWLNANVFS